MSAWWAIAEDEILVGLRRCAAGEDPDIVLLEMLANTDSEDVAGREPMPCPHCGERI